jgi:hypothetical protein
VKPNVSRLTHLLKKFRQRLQQGLKEPLPDAVAKEIKSDARYYLRLDLAYVAALAAAIGLLKLRPGQLPATLSELSVPAIGFGVLLACDTFLYREASEHWIAAKLGQRAVLPGSLLIRVAKAQPTLHFIFVLAIVLGAFGYATGVNSHLQTLRDEARLQTELDLFNDRIHRYPTSLTELQASDERVADILHALRDSNLRYEAVGTGGYRLIDDIHTGDLALGPRVRADQILKELGD